ncbi:ABC transporter permease [Ornithinimicrobium tianjinense]|uniref:Peptide ABC transporter permease n=1 Tax=Ornithinimicrobium tianjinense TaxID=1195761 RepID=A0A917BVI1_9MICO|nr:ABC transporter permease [Ornithinimicrobium tianjinense]GGF59016.1 peptide ABC transporter permease [Ornithinimicrobium tianjinense]
MSDIQGLPAVAATRPAEAPGRRRPLNPSLLIGGTIVAAIVLLALVSYVWTPWPPMRVLPTEPYQTPNAEHWLGTDKLRRDVFTQILVGARTTLFVGLVAVGVAAVVGVPLGILAAMTPGWLGQLVMRTNDVLLAFPALLLAIMFAALYGGSTRVAMIAIGIATIPAFARITRSGALSVMASEYVVAARAAGRSPLGIAWRHVLPNVAGLVIVQASVSFAIAILAEAALAYLGLGTPTGQASWGRMLFEAQTTLRAAPHLALIPGGAIALSVLGFNLFGDGLRDWLDPKLEGR